MWFNLKFVKSCDSPKKNLSSTPYFREWLKRKVGQVVLVVVDALRADFVFPENILAKIGVASAQYMDESKDSNVVMQRPKIKVLTDWIQNSNPNVNAFVARANAPTVTMPRIKVKYSVKISWNLITTYLPTYSCISPKKLCEIQE